MSNDNISTPCHNTGTCSAEWTDGRGHLHVTMWGTKEGNDDLRILTGNDVRFEQGKGLFANNPNGL